MYFYARTLFGTIETSVDLQNDTVTEASLDSIHDFIGANIDLDLQDLSYYICSPTKRKIGTVGPGALGRNPRNTRETEKEKFMVMRPFHPLL